MTDSTTARGSIVALLTVLTVSAATMLWLFWRFPLTTAIFTLIFLGALCVLARLARSTDVEMIELESRKQSI